MRPRVGQKRKKVTRGTGDACEPGGSGRRPAERSWPCDTAAAAEDSVAGIGSIDRSVWGLVGSGDEPVGPFIYKGWPVEA